MFKVTSFKSKTYKTKIPIPTHPDKSFEFITKEVSTLEEIFNILSTDYITSKPLDISTIICPRRKEYIEHLIPSELNYLILDIDKIKNEDSYNKVIDFFKSKKYKVLLGKSRSWNGEDNFNIKGILEISIVNDIRTLKELLYAFSQELDCCKFDLASCNNNSLQAPMKRKDIIYQGGNIIISYNDIKIEQKEIKLNNFSGDFINVCIEEFYKLGFTPIQKSNSNGTINFKHFSEVKSKGGYFWSEKLPYIMWHNNEIKTVNIYKTILNTPIGKKFFMEKFELKNIELLTPKEIQGNVTYVNSRYLEISEEINESIQNFLSSEEGIFKIKSPMGTGKSNIIEHIIENAHSLDLKILIVSNRISVAKDFSDKYNIKMYGEQINDESLVVQFDSLYKYSTQEFDIIILDEFMSILLHHKSSLSNFQNINIAKFYSLMKSKKLVIADAFLIGFEDKFIENRPQWNLINTYRDDIELNIFSTKDYFLENLVEHAKTNKISASFSSLRMLEVVKKNLDSQGLRVQTLTSETPQHVKELIYSNFDKIENDKWDAILYSPTLTVGVSNNNLINRHYHFDEGNSMDVISSLQMIKRSRNVKEIYVFLGKRQFFREIDIDVLNTVTEETLGKYADKDKSLMFNYDVDSGTMKLSDIGKYMNTIESLSAVLENNHNRSFKVLLENQFKNKPKDISKKTSVSVKQEYKELKLSKEDKFLKDIDSVDLYHTQEELVEISTKKSNLSIRDRTLKVFANLTKEVHCPVGMERNFLIDTTKDKSFLENLKYLRIAMEEPSEVKKKLNYILSFQQLEPDEFFFYDYAINKKFLFKEYFTLKELSDVSLKRFIKMIGYKRVSGRYVLNKKLLKYLK